MYSNGRRNGTARGGRTGGFAVESGRGVWRRASATVGQIREAIESHQDARERVTTARAFRETFNSAGESLKWPPRRCAPDRPLVDDLKRKDFVAVTSFSEAEVVETDFLDWFAGIARRGEPLVEFLSSAVGVDF